MSPSPPPHAPLGPRVRRGAIWSGANALLLRLANIAIMAVVARLLLPHDFGVFAVAITVHAVVSSVGELGVSAVLARGDVDPEEVAGTVAAISITSSLVLGGAMMLFAEPVAAALGSSEAEGPVRVMALAVLLVGVFAVPGAELVRDFRQDRLFLATVVGFVPANVLLVVLASSGGGAMSFAWSRVVGQLITGAVMVASVGHYYRPVLRREVAGRVLRFGLPLAGANFVGWTLLNADYALVGPLLGPVELGLYMLAFNVASWSTALLGAMINNVAMPAFSRVRDDAQARARAVSSATQAVGSIALPLCALTLVLAGPLVETLYGDRWAEAAPALSILAVYGALFVICLLFGNVLVGQGHPRVLLYVQLAWLAALLPAMVMGVRLAGIVGAGVAHLVVVTCVVLPAYLIALRRWEIARPGQLIRALAAPFAGSCSAGAVAALVSALFAPAFVKLVVGGAAGTLLYAVVMSPVLRPYLRARAPHRGPLGRLAQAYEKLGGVISAGHGRALNRPAFRVRA